MKNVNQILRNWLVVLVMVLTALIALPGCRQGETKTGDTVFVTISPGGSRPTTDISSPATPPQAPVTQAGGSSDGTGDLLKTSEKQIRDSILNASVLMGSVMMDFMLGGYDPLTNTKIAIDGGKILPQELYYLVSPEFFEITFILHETSEEEPRVPYSRIQFLQKGLCKDSSGNEGTASVVTINGKPGVCLALEILKQLPVDYVPELLATLFIHEFSHIAGKDEKTANFAQQWFGRYNKARLDIGRFSSRLMPGWVMRQALRAGDLLIQQQKFDEICKDKAGFSAVAGEVDRSILFLRYAINGFDLEWSDPNQKEYWSRKAGNAWWTLCGDKPDVESFKKKFSELRQEYEALISQFGSTVPRELYK